MNSPDETLKAILKQPEVRTVDAARIRIERIDQVLPTRDGVAWFNKLYLKPPRT